MPEEVSVLDDVDDSKKQPHHVKQQALSAFLRFKKHWGPSKEEKPEKHDQQQRCNPISENPRNDQAEPERGSTT